MVRLGALLRRSRNKAEEPEAQAPILPSIDTPPLVVMIPDVAGVSSFRLSKFPDAQAAARFIQSLSRPQRERAHAFWALQAEPADPLDTEDNSGEAMVLIRSSEESDLVYVVSFVDIDSAQSFARFEVKRGMHLNLILIYWASMVNLVLSDDGVQLIPEFPPVVTKGHWKETHAGARSGAAQKRAGSDVSRLQAEAEEEKKRLQAELDEMEKLHAEAEELKRLQSEAAQKKRLQAEAEERRRILKAELDEIKQLRAEAEAKRRRLEAEAEEQSRLVEQEMLQLHADVAEKRRLQAETRALTRLQTELEEIRRLGAEAAERQKQSEKVAEEQRLASESDRKKVEDESETQEKLAAAAEEKRKLQAALQEIEVRQAALEELRRSDSAHEISAEQVQDIETWEAEAAKQRRQVEEELERRLEDEAERQRSFATEETRPEKGAAEHPRWIAGDAIGHGRPHADSEEHASLEVAGQSRPVTETGEQARLEAEAEQRRLDAEAEEQRLAAETAERARLEAEAEERRLEAEAKERRLAAEAEDRALLEAEAEEQRRLSAEAEERARVEAEAQDRRRLEEEAEQRFEAAKRAILAQEEKEAHLDQKEPSVKEAVAGSIADPSLEPNPIEELLRAEAESRVQVPRAFAKEPQDDGEPDSLNGMEHEINPADIADEVGKILRRRRWAKRESPFEGFKSPPGRF